MPLLKETKVGLLSPDGKWLFIQHETKGQLLDETVVDVPAAYSLISTDDPHYASPVSPAKVFRKGKPNGFSRPLPFSVHDLAEIAGAVLKEDATYTIRFVGVNTSQATVAYVHQPRRTQSLAVHAIQTGYRSDDPYKRAYLSFSMGVDQDGNSAELYARRRDLRTGGRCGSDRVHRQGRVGEALARKTD